MTVRANRAGRFLDRSVWRWRPGLATVLLVVAAASVSARAETYETVTDVPVDVTAKNAAAARDQAIAEAQSKAFERLAKRMAPAQADRLKPSQADIESLVQDFAVQSERASSVRYIGVYTVRFRAGRVLKYLSDHGLTGVAEQQQALVLPLFAKGSETLLWERGNEWRTAWQRGSLGDGPVTLILPNGDEADGAAVTVSGARSGDVGAFDQLLRRYHAVGLVVAAAEPRDPARGVSSGLSIALSVYDGRGARGAQMLTIDPAPGETPDRVLLRGVAAAADALEGGWRKSVDAGGSTGLAPPPAVAADSDSEPGQSGSTTAFPVFIPVSSLTEWVVIRDALNGIGGLQRVSLDALTRNAAAVTLDFAGDALALQAALSASGYVLVQVAPATAAGPGDFVLRRAGSSVQRTFAAPAP